MYQGYDPERIGLKPDWLIAFINMHDKNSPDAKYKIGGVVLYKGQHRTILAVNVQETGVVEYAISDCYNLVWEEELTIL